MNQQAIIQSEVNQKEKSHTLMHIYRIYKDGTDEFISGQQWRNRHRKQA